MTEFQASEMATAVSDGEITLRAAISWNLGSNHFPPIPPEYIDIVLSTVLAVQGGTAGPDDFVDLGEDLPMLPRRAFQHEGEGPWFVTVADLLSATHCWSFVEEEI